MSRTTRNILVATTLAVGVAFAAVPASAAPVDNVTSTAEHAGHDQDRRLPRIAQQWANAWNAGDAAAMGALFAPGGTYTDHAFQATFTGPAGAALWVQVTLQSISPAHVTIKDAFCSGDNVSVSWTFTGTFTDKAPLTPPYNATGKSFSVAATSVITTHNGRITSVDDYYNLADILRQVGLPAGPISLPGMG